MEWRATSLHSKESKNEEERRMNIMVLGYTEAGKSTAAEILAKMLNLKYANTSDRLIEDFAAQTDNDPDFVMQNKSKFRSQLFTYGRGRQAFDPLYPQSQQLKHANILTGLRNPNEIEAARGADMYDCIIWILRDGYDRGPTDKLSPDDADVTIENNGTISELKEKLSQLLSTLRT